MSNFIKEKVSAALAEDICLSYVQRMTFVSPVEYFDVGVHPDGFGVGGSTAVLVAIDKKLKAIVEFPWYTGRLWLVIDPRVELRYDPVPRASLVDLIGYSESMIFGLACMFTDEGVDIYGKEAIATVKSAEDLYNFSQACPKFSSGEDEMVKRIRRSHDEVKLLANAINDGCDTDNIRFTEDGIEFYDLFREKLEKKFTVRYRTLASITIALLVSHEVISASKRACSIR